MSKIIKMPTDHLPCTVEFLTDWLDDNHEYIEDLIIIYRGKTVGLNYLTSKMTAERLVFDLSAIKHNIMRKMED